MESAAHGDTGTVKDVFAGAHDLGMTVLRTWAFFDSPDSTNPAVIQYKPGVVNEQALRALDYVVFQAKLHDMRLLLPLVNSWDDYGGMNQYVRWRIENPLVEALPPAPRYSNEEIAKVVIGQKGQTYQHALTNSFGHDDFYSDPIIRGWFKDYVSIVMLRVNSYTGIQYKDDPTILGWELANEPRSSDRSTQLIFQWTAEMSSFIKSLDQNHLVGTGEEGFDNSAAGYSLQAYNNQLWLFDGSAGVSFSSNSAVSSIDFASIHLYPESWSLPNSAGNTWIRDHTRLAGGFGKPLLIGEFAVRAQKSLTYDSWLTTMLLDGAAGGIVWQLLGGSRDDREGFGLRCPEDGLTCSTLFASAVQFRLKSQAGVVSPPPFYSLQQNYPNPFNGQTIIAYDLPTGSHVLLELYNAVGQHVMTLQNGFQNAGRRKELLEVGSLASGVYLYRLTAEPQSQSLKYSQTKKLLLIK